MKTYLWKSLLKSKRATSPLSGPADLAGLRIVCFCAFPSFETQLEPYYSFLFTQVPSCVVDPLILQTNCGGHVDGRLYTAPCNQLWVRTKCATNYGHTTQLQVPVDQGSSLDPQATWDGRGSYPG